MKGIYWKVRICLARLYFKPMRRLPCVMKMPHSHSFFETTFAEVEKTIKNPTICSVSKCFTLVEVFFVHYKSIGGGVGYLFQTFDKVSGKAKKIAIIWIWISQNHVCWKSMYFFPVICLKYFLRFLNSSHSLNWVWAKSIKNMVTAFDDVIENILSKQFPYVFWGFKRVTRKSCEALLRGRRGEAIQKNSEWQRFGQKRVCLRINWKSIKCKTAFRLCSWR